MNPALTETRLSVSALDATALHSPLDTTIPSGSVATLG
jgi:hypothetical protein